MKKVLAVALLVLAVVVILIKSRPGDAEESTTNAVDAREGNGSTLSNPASARVTRPGKDVPLTEPEDEALESGEAPALTSVLQRMVDYQAGMDGALVEDLTTRLGLDAGQRGRVAALLADRRDKIAALLAKGADALSTAEGVKAIGSLLGEDYLAKNLAGVLSPEQMASYEESRKELLGRQVEGRAYQEFAKLAPVLELAEGQKDKVFEALHQASEGRLREEAGIRSVLAFMHQGRPGADQLAEMMMPTMIALVNYGDIEKALADPTRLTQVKAAEQKRIDADTAILSPHLTPEQTALYRNYLESSSLVNQLVLKAGKTDPAPGVPGSQDGSE